MLNCAVIIGSTRPGRKGEAVGRWVHKIASTRVDALFDLVDIADYNLPLLDEPIPPSRGKYSHAHTESWSARIDAYDAYVFVTPEYNHGTSGALKNAIDFLYKEWNNKAAAFVGYGSAGGVRAVEQLRLIMAEVQIATVRAQVILSFGADFDETGVFKPTDEQNLSVATMLDQLVSWGNAMKGVRGP